MMRNGKSLKNKSLNKNKIIIYQIPLFERILFIVSPFFLLAISIYGLIGEYTKIGNIILVLCMIFCCLFMPLEALKRYICLDLENKKLIIQEGPCSKKQEISIYGLVGFRVINWDKNSKSLFKLEVIFNGYTNEIYSWSVGMGSKYPILTTNLVQRKRLENFCEECNKYLNDIKIDK